MEKQSTHDATSPSSTSQQYQPLQGYATSPQLPHGEKPAQTRILYAENEGKSRRKLKILDGDGKTHLYTTEVQWSSPFTSKPDTTIYRASDNSVVATLYFHNFSGHIDINIQGQTIEFNNKKTFSMDHDFSSPTLQETLRWKKDGKWYAGGLICLNEKEQPLATFENKGASLREGKLEIGAGIGGKLLDELVVCAIALAELARRSRDAAIMTGVINS